MALRLLGAVMAALGLSILLLPAAAQAALDGVGTGGAGAASSGDDRAGTAERLLFIFTNDTAGYLEPCG